MNPTGTGASFRKRSTWATLIATLVIFGVALIMTLRDPTDAARTTWLLLGATVLQIWVLIISRIVFAVRTEQQPDDERDMAIVLRSLRASHPILAIGMMLAILGILLQQVLPANTLGELWGSPMLVGHLLIWSFVGSEVVRLATQAVGYRTTCP